MKRFLSLAVMALLLTSAKAGVAINSTNFPDNNFRAQVKEYFDNIDYKKGGSDNVYYPQYLFRIDDKKLKYDLLNKISKPSQRKFK